MAFKGIDFAKMAREAEERRAMPPEELAALQAREGFATDARHVVADECERAKAAAEVRVLHLADRPYTTFGLTEELRSTLYYVPPGQEPDFERAGNVSRAVYASSEAERLTRNSEPEAQPLEAMLGRLERGSVVTVLGEERSRRFKDDRSGTWSTVKEFHAIAVAEGELTRERMMEHRHGGAADRLVDAATAHEATSDPAEREAIARRHLGQAEAATGRAAAVSLGKGPSAQDAEIDGLLAGMVARAKGGQGR